MQSTSIPGVAQRTGATTYYIEILPVPARELGGRQPVLALTPGLCDVDLIVASELMEAARTVANGFASAERTTLIASTHRAYAIAEKMAMGDGRYDETRLTGAIAAHSRSRLLFDMDSLARESGAAATRLETNDSLVEAIAMYRSAGYQEVEPFNDEPFADRWFQKQLA